MKAELFAKGSANSSANSPVETADPLAAKNPAVAAVPSSVCGRIVADPADLDVRFAAVRRKGDEQAVECTLLVGVPVRDLYEVSAALGAPGRGNRAPQTVEGAFDRRCLRTVPSV